jgi:hypothetical protein
VGDEPRANAAELTNRRRAAGCGPFGKRRSRETGDGHHPRMGVVAGHRRTDRRCDHDCRLVAYAMAGPVVTFSHGWFLRG